MPIIADKVTDSKIVYIGHKDQISHLSCLFCLTVELIVNLTVQVDREIYLVILVACLPKELSTMSLTMILMTRTTIIISLVSSSSDSSAPWLAALDRLISLYFNKILSVLGD